MNDQAMNSYELIYIIQPQLDENGINSVNERMTQAIAGQNGQVISTEVWGQRKLAYPIRNHFVGYYVLHNMEMPPSGVTELERILRLNEDVIRFLIFRKDEDGGEE